MFDSVLDRGSAPKSAFGTGTVITILVHVGLLLFALWFSNRAPDEDKKETEVTFFAAAPPPPPPPPPAGNNTPHVEKKVEKKKPVRKPDTIVQPKEIPKETPQETPQEEPAEEPENDSPAGVEGGVVGGVEGGVVGGVVGGKIGGTLGGTGTDVVPFGEGMSRPERLEGAMPEYTREAREAHVEGIVIVKCTIMADGHLENCRLVKSLPFLDENILAAVRKWRYKPVTFQGRPINVDYVINFKLQLR